MGFVITLLIVIIIAYIIFEVRMGSPILFVLDCIDIQRFKHHKEFKYTYLNQCVPSLTPEEENVLKQKFAYYNSLSHDKQLIFGYRIKRFLEDKSFIGMEELEVVEEMQLLIAATAVKLTFGLRYYTYNCFHTFRIYPSQFYSRLVNSYMYGGASISGVMSLAWDNFLHGFETTVDNINLGFHEFAHALIISQQNDITIPSFKLYTADYDFEVEYAKGVMANDDFFREYAFTNDMEFFAVAVEHFFENPVTLREKLPNLYLCLAKMLLQDPAGNTPMSRCRTSLNGKMWVLRPQDENTL